MQIDSAPPDATPEEVAAALAAVACALAAEAALAQAPAARSAWRDAAVLEALAAGSARPVGPRRDAARAQRAARWSSGIVGL
jgi:hypothetical protein